MGIAVAANDAPASQLQELKAQGVVGVAFNFALHRLAHCRQLQPLLERLEFCPLLQLFAACVTNPQDRRKILWDTPLRLFGFSD